MPQQFFNRVAKLTIATPITGGGLDIGIVISTPMRITFEITKTAFSIANIGTITVNNLSDQTRNIIRQDRNLIAILEAGYVAAGGSQLLFYGDIVDVSHNIEKPEIITTITAMDGHSAIKQTKISVSYKKGTPLSQIIKDCAKSLGLPMSSTFSYLQLPTQNITAPMAFAGPAADWLDKLCDDNGLAWSVQNGAVKINSLTQTDGNPPLSTALIGSPKRLFKNMISQSLLDFSGYEFNALLMPRCEPYCGVTLQSNEIKTAITLMAMEVKHSGDLYGADWKTTVKAKDLK